MKNFLVLSMFLLVFSSVIAQGEKVNKLVECLNDAKISSSLEMLAYSSNKKSLNSRKEIVEKLSKIYIGFYSSDEIEKLLNFYKSSIGQKLLKNKDSISDIVNQELYSWEMKQQGIDISTFQDDLITTDSPVDNQGALLTESEKEITQKSVLEKKQEKVKITSLKQLKKYLQKNKNIMYDPMQLSEILGFDLFESPEEENEIATPKQ